MCAVHEARFSCCSHPLGWIFNYFPCKRCLVFSEAFVDGQEENLKFSMNLLLVNLLLPMKKKFQRSCMDSGLAGGQQDLKPMQKEGETILIKQQIFVAPLN